MAGFAVQHGNHSNSHEGTRGEKPALEADDGEGAHERFRARRHPWLQLAATLLNPFSPHQLFETAQEVLRATDRASVGGETCFPLLAETFGRNSPCRDWGINE